MVHDGGVVCDIVWFCIVQSGIYRGWVVGARVMVYVQVRFWWRLSECGGVGGVGRNVWVGGVVDCD